MANVLEMEPSGSEDSRSLSAVDSAWLDDCFLYHAPSSEQKDQLFEINAAAKEFAKAILLHAPISADRSVALRLVREAKMWTNSAIVLEGRR